MSDGIPQFRSPSTALGEAQRLAGADRTAEAERVADRGRLEQSILQRQEAETQASIGAIGQIARFAGDTLDRIFTVNNARKRARAQTQLQLRMANIGREISKSDDPKALLESGVIDLDSFYKEARASISHEGQASELDLFYDDTRAMELPVLAEMVEARELELYRADFTEEVSAMELEGDWAGVLDRYERGFDDGMLDRTAEQQNMENAVREASIVDASRNATVVRDREGWDAAITWLNSTEAREQYPYLKGQDFRSLQQDVRSQREVEEMRAAKARSDQFGAMQLWAMEEADKGTVASLSEIRAQMSELAPDLDLEDRAKLEQFIYSMFDRRRPDRPDPIDTMDRYDTEAGRVVFQALETAGRQLTRETAPSYYDRVNSAHQGGWINHSQRKELFGYYRTLEEEIGDDVARQVTQYVDDFAKLTLLEGFKGVHKNEQGQWRVSRRFLGRLLGPDKPAPLQKLLDEAEEDIVTLSDESYRDMVLNAEMPLVRPDGSMATITLNEMAAYVTRNTREILNKQTTEGKEIYNPRELVQSIWWQTMAGYMPGLQLGEWGEVVEPPEGIIGPAALEPSYQGAVVPDPGTTRTWFLGPDVEAPQRHPIARAFEFMGEAPGAPTRIRAQPLARLQGVAALEALGTDTGMIGAVQELIDQRQFDLAQELAAALLPANPEILDQLQEQGHIFDWHLEQVDDAGGFQFMVRFNPRSVPQRLENE